MADVATSTTYEGISAKRADAEEQLVSDTMSFGDAVSLLGVSYVKSDAITSTLPS